MSAARPVLFDEGPVSTDDLGKAQFPLLLSPFVIGKVKFRNRFVFQPHFTALCNIDGTPSRDIAAYHEERARGGAALIVFEGQAASSMPGIAAPLLGGHSTT